MISFKNCKWKFAKGSEKKYILIIGLISVIAIIFLMGNIQKNCIVPLAPYPLELVRVDASEELETIAPGTKYRQEVAITTEEIQGVSISIESQSDNSTVSILDSENKEIASWKISQGIKGENGFTNFMLSEKLVVDSDSQYQLQIDNQGEASIKLYKASQLDKSIAYEILGQQNNVLLYVSYLLEAILIMILVITVFLLCRNKSIELILTVSVFLFGCLYIFLIAPYTVPDEERHFATAYSAASTILGQEAKDGKSIIIRKSDYDYWNEAGRADGDYNTWYMTKESYIRTAKEFFAPVTEEDNETRCFSQEVSVSKVAYFPQIIGILIARLLGLNAVQLFMLGRFMSLILFCVVIYCSVKLMPFAKMAIGMVGLFPITLQQVASYSYDAMCISMSILLISYIMHLTYKKENIEKKDVVVILIASLALALAKPIYLIVLGLAIFIPDKKFGGTLKKYLLAGVIIAACVIAYGASVYIISLDTVEIASTTNTGRVIYSGAAGYTIAELLTSPKLVAQLLSNTLKAMGTLYYMQAFGSQLGWLQIGIPSLYCVGFTVLCCYSVFPVKGEDYRFDAKHRIWCFVLVGALVAVVFMTLLYSWTSKSDPVICGIQGRYFTPVLPLLFLVLRGNNLTLVKNADKKLMYAGILLQIITVTTVFKSVILL